MLPVFNYQLCLPEHKKQIIHRKTPLLLKEADTKALQFDREYRVLNEVHCPLCGVNMLSENGVDVLAKRAEKVKYAKEFVNLLEDNRWHIKTDNLFLLDYAQEYVKRNPKASFDDFINVSSAMSKSLLSKSLNKHAEFFLKEANSGKYRKGVSDNLNIVSMWLDSFMPSNEINRGFPYKDWKNEFSEFFAGYGSKKKWKFFEPVKRDIRNKSEIYNMLRSQNGKKVTPSELIKKVVKKSVSRVTILDSASKYKVITCPGCYIDVKKSGIKSVVKRRPTIFKNIKKYCDDILNNASAGNLSTGRTYSYNIKKYLNSLIKIK